MAKIMSTALGNLQAKLKEMSAEDGLAWLSEKFSNKVCFGTSFGYEDQAIIHMIAARQLNISIFTLDTGRLFPETYTVWNETLDRYRIPIKTYYPDNIEIQQYVTENGPNSFYHSVDLRKKCCYLRKIAPLKKALEHNEIWITGIRAGQSLNREQFDIIGWDESNAILKYNPLLHWTGEQLNNYIHQNKIPYNLLHDQGFPSIGCAPCTRAVTNDEDLRAGRWWWEEDNKKECGLHGSQTIKLTS